MRVFLKLNKPVALILGNWGGRSAFNAARTSSDVERRIMFTIRMFIEVIVRNVVVARAIVTTEQYRKSSALRELENTVREYINVPTNFTVTTKVIKVRNLQPGESQLNDLIWTNNVVSFETHRSDKAWQKDMAAVAYQQKISAENKLNHGNFKGASNGSQKQQKKGVFTS